MPGRAPRARRSQGRGKKQSERSSVIPPDPPSSNADVILVDLSSCNADSLTVPQFPRRGSRRNMQPRARPLVISLDVTYSSDELENEIPSSPEKEPDTLLNFSLTPSSNGAVSSDDDIHPNASSPLSSPVKEKVEDTEENKEIQNGYSDCEEEDDILFVDYNAKRDAALKRAFTEIRTMEKEAAVKKLESPNGKSSCDSVTQDDEEDLEHKSGDLDISCVDSPVVIPKKRRKGRETVKKALESLKQFSQELSQLKGNDSFDGDITVLSDVDDDAENEIVTLFVKFESNYIRCRVRQFQKFSSVYGEVADRLSVNAAQVLLCHDDKVISRDKCPMDLKLKYGAIIECGVQSQSAVLVKETVTKQSPGTIPLKVQNSDRKGIVTIFIRPDAKMKELMHRYAEEKNIPVEELHFSFDGETLNPNDTPKSLDLEGNECIDVYRT